GFLSAVPCRDLIQPPCVVLRPPQAVRLVRRVGRRYRPVRPRQAPLGRLIVRTARRASLVIPVASPANTQQAGVALDHHVPRISRRRGNHRDPRTPGLDLLPDPLSTRSRLSGSPARDIGPDLPVPIG